MEDIEAQQAYADQQRFDGYARAVHHGVARKAAFDNRVTGSKTGEVVFAAGDLVQVLDPKYQKTFLSSKKILPEWSGALRVKERILNSYIIETIYGQELDGKYSARRLRPLIPPRGSSLEAYEAAIKTGAITRGKQVTANAQAVFEDAEPSREEAGTAREMAEEDLARGVGADEEEKDWVDEEEAVGDSIGQRLRLRKTRAQATRTLPGGGGQMR
ncbi:hypothetical protein C8R44DRAFT_637308 [Mycena epipterygia]|nr:hypothetical protein C8R44DRAFT_637308 [Mycena epipterygia]